MAVEATAGTQPSRVRVVVVNGSNLPDAAVFVELRIGSERFMTEAEQGPSPVWNTEADLKVRNHSELKLIARSQASGSKLGYVAIDIGTIPDHRPQKSFKAALKSKEEGAPSPGTLTFDCWVVAREAAAPESSTVLQRLFTSPKSARKRGAARPLSLAEVGDGEVAMPTAVQAAPPPTGQSASASASPNLRRSNSRPTNLGVPKDDFAVAAPNATTQQQRIGHRRSSSFDTHHRRVSAPAESLATQTTNIGLFASVPDLPSATVSAVEATPPEVRKKRDKKHKPADSSAPIVTGISPNSCSLDGGAMVTLRGTNFGTELSDVEFVSVAGVDCTSTLSFISSKILKVVALPGKAGSGPVVVRLKNGLTGTSDVEFSYKQSGPQSTRPMSARPEVNGVSPRCGPSTGGTAIKIRGKHLGRDKDDLFALYIAGVDCSSKVTLVTPTLIECATIPGTGAGAIVPVTLSGGVGSSLVQFSFYRRSDTPSTKHEDFEALPQFSNQKLVEEVTSLRQQLEESQEENKRLHAYIESLLVKLLKYDQTASFLERTSSKKA